MLSSPIKQEGPYEQEVSPVKESQQSYASAQNSWNSWDAKKADKEMEIRRQQILASEPEPETLVFNETFRQAVVDENGVRVVSSSRRRIIDRRAPLGEESNGFAQDNAPKAPVIKEVPSSPVKHNVFDDLYDASDPEDVRRARPGKKIPKTPALMGIAGPPRISPVKALSDEVSLLDLDDGREISVPAIADNISSRIGVTDDQEEDLISFE